MNRLPMSTCLWTACMLLVGACSSSPGPTAAASPTAKHAAPALAGADVKTAPKWPRTDIAERRFDTDRMFIEQDGRAWHAWAVSRPDKGRVRAMEFFTGAVIEGRLDVDATSPRHYVLTDGAGKSHRWFADASFQPRLDPSDGNGAMYSGHGDIALDFGDTVFASDSQGLCPLELHVVARQPGKERADMSSAWAKIAMHHAPPDGDCPSSEWISEVRSTLDLQDGTFLAAIGDRLFRLNMADLSAAGQAPSLRIIDAARAQAIAKRIVVEQMDDPNGYLTQTLVSSTDPQRERMSESTHNASSPPLANGEYATEHGWGRLLVTQTPDAGNRFKLTTTNGEATCAFDGRIEGTQGIPEDSDGVQSCRLQFSPSDRGISISTQTRDACRELCGVNGSFEGEYARLSPDCTREAIAIARRKFKQAYDRRAYEAAIAMLSPVLDQCITTADWEEEGGLRNDFALSLYKAGRQSECLKVLAPYHADAKRRDDDVIADWPPTLADRYLAIVKAARTNIRLCSTRK